MPSDTSLYKAFPDSTGALDKERPAEVQVVLRQYELDDAKLVLHSWLRSSRSQFNQATDHDYYEGMQKQIMRIAKNAHVVVAADREKPWWVYGYAVGEPWENKSDPLVMHYVFVKLAYRRQGIATALMEAHGWYHGREVVATHWHYYLNDIRRIMKLRYNPWYLNRAN